MPNLHIIIGDADMRKSSLLRCLVGVGGKNVTTKVTRNGNEIAMYKRYSVGVSTSPTPIWVLCFPSALQESYDPQTPQEFILLIENFMTECKERDLDVPTDIAITLRVRGTSGGTYPDYDSYISAFKNKKWPIESVALLGKSACSANSATFGTSKIFSEINSDLIPTNITAANVRKIWQWV